MKTKVATYIYAKHPSSDEIYKIYKHGGDLSRYNARKVYLALKKNHLQVVMVLDNMIKWRVFNYIQEKNKFYQIV